MKAVTVGGGGVISPTDITSQCTVASGVTNAKVMLWGNIVSYSCNYSALPTSSTTLITLPSDMTLAFESNIGGICICNTASDISKYPQVWVNTLKQIKASTNNGAATGVISFSGMFLIS